MQDEPKNYCVVTWDRKYENDQQELELLEMLLGAAFKAGQRDFGNESFYIKIEYIDSRVADNSK